MKKIISVMLMLFFSSYFAFINADERIFGRLCDDWEEESVHVRNQLANPTNVGSVDVGRLHARESQLLRT